MIETVPTGTGREVGLLVRPHRLRFATRGTYLTFSFLVTGDLTLASYAYDFRHANGDLIWRKDNYPGHEHEEGSREHIHKDPSDEGRTEPYHEPDFQQVLDQIAEFHGQQKGTD